MPSPNRSPRVIYADDNEDSCLMLSTLLGLSNIEVSLAHTAKEAFQLAQKKDFDAYLLESELPDGDGFELCQKLRSLVPQKPIFFIQVTPTKAISKKGWQQEPTNIWLSLIPTGLLRQYFNSLNKLQFFTTQTKQNT